MSSIKNHEFFMYEAINEARKAKEIGEVPVGAVLVINNEVISKGHNSQIFNIDPTAHAEINVIRESSKKISNYRHVNSTLYVTLEPCLMCYGAIIHARISRLVFGAYDSKTGVCGSSIKLHEQECFNHTPELLGGVLEEDCSSILKDFFKERRN